MNENNETKKEKDKNKRKNKPGRANRCVRSGFVYEINAFQWYWAGFGGFALVLTDGRTYGQTDGRMNIRTDGRTDPLIEMRGRI